MPFDGGFTHRIAAELNNAADCHIDKIYQPSRDELVFLLRKKGFSARLLLSAKSGVARVQFTEQKYENPDTPPMFCMLARKHFSGARFIQVVQPAAERILEFYFETTNEMGDRVLPRIVCELIGNQSNIILVEHSGRVIDAVRRSDPETAQRLLLPGAVYQYPAEQGKKNPLTADENELLQDILAQREQLLSFAILSVIDGISPLIAREIAFSAYGDDITVCQITDITPLKNALQRVLNDFRGGSTFYLLMRNGSAADFSYTEITQYGAISESVPFENANELLDAYYAEREKTARRRMLTADVERAAAQALSRAQKRLAKRRQELSAGDNREQLRIWGELLKANLYSIPNGATFATVCNYYDPEMATVQIPLNPALTPAANAAKYFKDYKKSCTAQQTLAALTQEDESEIKYLESVIESLSHCENSAELAEIREELSEGGYIRKKTAGYRRKKENTAYRIFQSEEGYRVIVGRNNRQNDFLTTRLATKNDIWMHAKNIAGSHVVICNEGAQVSEKTLLAAAQLAAFYSKAGASEQVPIDYTPIKYVKKPNGAKPGMVIYTTNQTLFVKPNGAALPIFNGED